MALTSKSLTIKVQEIVRVTNDAMAPQLLPGDILFLERRIPPDNLIIGGRPYVILLKTNEVLIRRIYPEIENLKLIADNDTYPNKSISREKVAWIKDT